MKLPSDYEQTQAVEGSGGSRRLPADGYVCKVCDVKETKTVDGRPMLELWLDVFEGPYKEFFAQQYSAAIRYGNSNPKWRCIYRQPLIRKDGTTNPCFKGMITAVSDSNPNAVIVHQGNLNVEAMRNCVVGCVFKEEHSVWQSREIIRAVPDSVIDVKKIRKGEFKVPAPKLLTPEEKAELQGFTTMTAEADDTPPF